MKILLVDDHTLVRDGISLVLEQFEDNISILTASTAKETLSLLAKHEDTDLVLMDVGLPDSSGIDCLKRIRQLTPLIPVVMLSANDGHETVRAAIDAGARGFIPKSAGKEIMLSAIQLIMAGGIYLPESSMRAVSAPQGEAGSLTRRQREVLQRLAEGKSNKAIANELGMSEATVRVHVTSIFKVLDVCNRTEAALKARELFI